MRLLLESALRLDGQLGSHLDGCCGWPWLVIGVVVVKSQNGLELENSLVCGTNWCVCARANYAPANPARWLLDLKPHFTGPPLTLFDIWC